MNIDFSKTNQLDRYKLMSQSIIPRPIAWIVTEHNKIVNIAPFSYFTALSSNPPTVVVSIGHKKDGTPKDTLKNIRKNRTCTVCIASPKELNLLHLSSEPLDYNQSEAAEYNIKTQSIYKNFPPMIRDIQIAYFCTLYQEIDLKGSKTVPLILEINYMYIDDSILTDREKLHFSVNPIARIGKSYNLIGEELIITKSK